MVGIRLGWFRRFRFWLYRYDLEIGVGALVAVSSWRMLAALGTFQVGTYHAIVIVCALLMLFVATMIMFNTARTRASAAEILDELRRVDGKKTTADVI